uniref:EGF-like domain-containing protein n=1 Tax=Romanomermis culicivorax TaxID=13658 RepID=A0A915IUZ0_ROMCU
MMFFAVNALFTSVNSPHWVFFRASYDAGYPYGRLAHFASPFKASFLDAIKSKLGSAGPFVAWIGAGNKHWLNASMQQVGDDVSLPNVTYSFDVSGCTAANTKTKPWRLQEMNCSMQNAYVCEMSWDCALVNPCQNFGACMPVTDGPTCSCYPGTSGAFCEKGRIQTKSDINAP